MATQEAHAVYVRRLYTSLAYLRALYYIFSVYNGIFFVHKIVERENRRLLVRTAAYTRSRAYLFTPDRA